LIHAGLAISGIFELGPLRDTVLNDRLRLTDAEIETLSPPNCRRWWLTAEHCMRDARPRICRERSFRCPAETILPLSDSYRTNMAS
jgi:hypothetical protein